MKRFSIEQADTDRGAARMWLVRDNVHLGYVDHFGKVLLFDSARMAQAEADRCNKARSVTTREYVK